MASTFTRGSSLHALVYDAVCIIGNGRGLREWRKVLVGDLSGDIVEIGVGTGLNLPYYSIGARVLASDYDPVMLARAVPRARSAHADVELFVADAMALPFDSGSVDVLVIGMMLCSVPDPTVALAETRRVLRPGGRLRFMEHIRGPDGSVRGNVQDALNPAWRIFSGGCNANRRSVERVVDSGFDLRRLYEFKLGLPHLRPLVVGEAVLR